MVLSKEELQSALQNEVRILVHLAGKVDKTKVDYRPTRTQRSTLELLQYLSMMGPTLLAIFKTGKLDRDTLGSMFRPAEAAAKELNFDQAFAAIQKQSDDYARLLSDWSDADFRAPIEMFGNKTTGGALIVNLVLGGHAAYRNQLFCYLKSCGRDELSTMNLWFGVDAPMPA
jgi:hypothetical protein